MARKKKAVHILTLAALLLGVFVWKGLDQRLTVRSYTVESEKLTEPVRIVFLSDLHSCDYGEGQGELLEKVEAQAPDAVLLGGDWVDDDFGRLPPARAYAAAKALAERWPVYYVAGNHEVWSGLADEIKTNMAACGVTVLSGERAELMAGGQPVQICGIDDPDAGERSWMEQLQTLKQETAGTSFSILLTHRPERIAEYGGFDLALAGHAHGGQWRIPGLINGLFAPNQGLFPEYAGGKYLVDGGGVLIVGRGLARESTRLPRFYNPPEVVTVDLLPAVCQE